MLVAIGWAELCMSGDCRGLVIWLVECCTSCSTGSTISLAVLSVFSSAFISCTLLLRLVLMLGCSGVGISALDLAAISVDCLFSSWFFGLSAGCGAACATNASSDKRISGS